MGRSGVQEHTDQLEGGILDDQNNLVPDVIAVTRRISPFGCTLYPTQDFLPLFIQVPSFDRPVFASSTRDLCLFDLPGSVVIIEAS